MNNDDLILRELDASLDPICVARHDLDDRLGPCLIIAAVRFIHDCRDAETAPVCANVMTHIDRARSLAERFICDRCKRPANQCWWVSPL